MHFLSWSSARSNSETQTQFNEIQKMLDEISEREQKQGRLIPCLSQSCTYYQIEDTRSRMWNVVQVIRQALLNV